MNEVIIFVVLGAAIGLFLFVAYRGVKKLAVCFWRLESLDRRVTSIDETMVKSIQADGLLYLYRLLDWTPGTLPPTRGWAASPDFLIILAEWILEHKPRVVLEFGSGVTSLVIARALQINGDGILYSVDHDDTFGAITQSRLKRIGLESHYIHAPLTRPSDAADSLPWYDFKGIDRPINLLVIDGPPAILGAEIRIGAARLFDQLAHDGVVLLDDASRVGERAIASKWAVQWPYLRQVFIGTEKGTLLMTNTKASLLTTNFSAEHRSAAP